MKTLHCTACNALVFFENTRCLSCGHQLAFVAQEMAMVALDQQADGSWLSRGCHSPPRSYRLCVNYTQFDTCNWAIPIESPELLCASCGLTQTIPDLGIPANRTAWLKLEMAKRRLMFDLLTLRLPLQSKRQDPAIGLEFEFLSDFVTLNGDKSRVLTGHDNGLITINVSEADDLYRETQRINHAEPLRNLLGHFRHEVGHYYWDRLIQTGDQLLPFRELFGNEESDYQAALKAHYEQGAPADWPENYISAYASTHPWEDWAESWAHVLHMADALDTAHAIGMSIKPARRDEPSLNSPDPTSSARLENFDALLSEWYALTYVLNNFTRGLGLPDAYPFVLFPAVVAKLRFVAGVIVNHAVSPATQPSSVPPNSGIDAPSNPQPMSEGTMSAYALVVWTLGAPLLVAIVEWFITRRQHSEVTRSAGPGPYADVQSTR